MKYELDDIALPLAATILAGIGVGCIIAGVAFAIGHALGRW